MTPILGHAVRMGHGTSSSSGEGTYFSGGAHEPLKFKTKIKELHSALKITFLPRLNQQIEDFPNSQSSEAGWQVSSKGPRVTTPSA